MMRKKIGLCMVLAILVSGPAISPSPAKDTAIRGISNQYFLGQYKLYDGRLILKARDHLELTPEQEKKIERRMLTFEEFSISRSAQIKIDELHLASALRSDPVDRELIENQIRQISRKKIELSIAYLNYLLDVKMVLTDSQISMLSKLRKRFTPRPPK